jgi:adenylate kinase
VRIVLLGAPGAGKGTQGKRMSARLGVRHIASGELLREHVAAQSDLGVEVAGFLERGDLVPDDLVLAVVCDAVVPASESGGYILDGFPRTRAQAERAYELAREKGIEADVAVYLALDDSVARSRLAGRAEGGRVDDADDAVVAHRLQIFHDNMQPLLDFYRRRGILVTVDAAAPIGAVTDAVVGAVASLGA